MVVEPDTYYYDADGVYRWSPEARVLAWESCFERFETLLGTELKAAVIVGGVPGAGKSTWAQTHDRRDIVIFDGVFTDPGLRRRAVDICHRAGAAVRAVWLDTDWQTCLGRNALRSPDRRVPLNSMKAFRGMLVEQPPSTAEGFLTVEHLR